jgi:hypothetical protein
MARDPVAPSPARPGGWAWYRPWPVLAVGLLLTVAGLGLAQFIHDHPPNPDIAKTSGVPLTGGLVTNGPQYKPPDDDDYVPAQGEWLNPYRFLLLFAGVLLAGIAVRQRFAEATWQLDGRLETAAVLASAAVVALLAYLGLARDWDSGHMVLIALILVAVAGALLVLLPRPVRLVVVSAWVLFHFGGIFVACIGSDPTQTQSPWLARKASEYLYRHYLGFLYLTNAYHFYSPDPGPQDLIWFRIKYADGTVREVRMPERGHSPVPLHFTRRVALGNSIMMSVPYIAHLDAVLAPIVQKRSAAIAARGIPLHPALHISLQYQEPTESTKLYLASYVRHIAHEYPHPDGKPEIAIESIRLYHVIHDLMQPRELAEGASPTAPFYYRPYYMGEYKPTGAYTEAGKRDPLLYWLLPIFKDPNTDQLFDGLKRHTEGRIVDPNEKELD